MPNDPAPPPTRAQLADSLWAIRPDAYAQIVASVAAGERSALSAEEPTEPQAAGIVRAGGGGGAIAVIPIQGIIRPRPSLFSFIFGGGGTSVVGLRASLRNAVGDSSVGAIVLDVDSPGGFVDGIPELADEIRAAREDKPVIAVANTHAASAAYWLASQATELIVSPSGQVGSIGVFVSHEDWSKFDERMGVKTTLISAGKFKTEGNPFEPLSDEARAAIQGTVDEYYGMFVAAVAKGRKVAEAKVRGGFGEGRMVLAADAKAEGMADRVGTLEDAISRAADLASGRGRGTRAEGGAPAQTTDGLDALIAAEVARQLEAMPPASPEASPAPGDEGTTDEDPWAELAATSQSFRVAMAQETP